MSTMAKQDKHGFDGEARTVALLASGFWLLQRSVDVDGVDHLVQIPAETLEELQERGKRVQVFGLVQSKFFEGRNQVRIQREYVEDDKGARPDFFALIHTDDRDGEPVYFFFTGQEIVNSFYLDESRKHYCFSITDTRDYAKFRNLKKSKIHETIKSSILMTEKERNATLLRIVYVSHPSNDRAPERVSSETYRKIEANGMVYELRQVGSTITGTKLNPTTGSTSHLPNYYGRLDQVEFDPGTESYRTR